jgi:hypothetical protein
MQALMTIHFKDIENQIIEEIKNSKWQTLIEFLVNSNFQKDADHYFQFSREIKIAPLMIWYLSWKYFLRIGKIQNSKFYANKYIESLVEFKMIPALIRFISDLERLKIKLIDRREVNNQLAFIQGIKESNEEYLNQDWHADHWKSEDELLKKKYFTMSDWDKEKYKLGYEIILKYKDIDVIHSFKEQFNLSKDYRKKYSIFAASKLLNDEVISTISKENETRIDFDQLALNFFENQNNNFEKSEYELVSYVQELNEKSVISEGSQLLTALKMLEFNEAVKVLARRLFNLSSDEEVRINALYFECVALFNLERYYLALDNIDFALSNLDLKKNEWIAFLELNAIINDLNGNKDLAKKAFNKIKLINPNYKNDWKKIKRKV